MNVHRATESRNTGCKLHVFFVLALKSVGTLICVHRTPFFARFFGNIREDSQIRFACAGLVPVRATSPPRRGV